MRGRTYKVPSIGIDDRYIRLRIEAIEKLPDDFIGFFVRYDKINQVLRIKTISVNEPDVIGHVCSRAKEPRYIAVGNDLLSVLQQHGIHEMAGEWNEDAHEFTFKPVAAVRSSAV